MTQLSLFPLPPAVSRIRELAPLELAFHLGQIAGECGQPIEANPFSPPGSCEWCEWTMGWRDGREQATEPPWEWWAYLYPERFARELTSSPD